MNTERIIETKICKHCHINFDITDRDLEFYDKISPSFSWIKYNIPSPTLCSYCRHQRRLSFRNERYLYKWKSDLTWKDVISMYSPDKLIKFNEQSEWWSDKWNPLDYWLDFDFNEPFFYQFERLFKNIPHSSLLNASNENSEYSNYCSYLKNCYLLFDSSNCEHSHYWYNVWNSTYSLDSIVISSCENIYECIDCINCYNVFFSQNCNWCRDSYFLDNCRGCLNCIGCCNLSNKQYYIDNEFVWKEKYEQSLKKIKNNFIKHKEYYLNKVKNYPKKYAFLIQTENVYWNSMISSKNCYSCFDWIYFEDCKYCSNWSDMKDTYDCESVWIWSSLSYELNASMRADRVLFSFGCWGSNIIYSISSTWNNLFWCVGLHNNESYCILNKQYTK
ncbi:MAG: hypothetical protein ACD_4C00272G0001, partial [uncultured bacterium (gcode 4)]